MLAIPFYKLLCIKSRIPNAESTANQETKSMSEYGGKTTNLTKIVRWNYIGNKMNKYMISYELTNLMHYNSGASIASILTKSH